MIQIFPFLNAIYWSDRFLERFRSANEGTKLINQLWAWIEFILFFYYYLLNISFNLPFTLSLFFHFFMLLDPFNFCYCFLYTWHSFSYLYCCGRRYCRLLLLLIIFPELHESFHQCLFLSIVQMHLSLFNCSSKLELIPHPLLLEVFLIVKVACRLGTLDMGLL